jgi:adenosylhomocysteine nucleosidase
MAIANGAGANRAFVAALLAKEISAVINIGFAGALDPKLEIGDVVVASKVDDGATIYPTKDPRGPGPPEVTVATIDHIAATAAEKQSLHQRGASIVEMEAAGAARGAEDLNVPFYCIRAVSDLATEDFANDFNAALGPDGRFSTLRLVTSALRSPSTRFRELIELQKRTALAAKNLGEFLVHCKF